MRAFFRVFSSWWREAVLSSATITVTLNPLLIAHSIGDLVAVDAEEKQHGV
jgi:hypothetical protein